MGQYYRPVNLDNLEFLSPYDYNNGLKLMEHSWIGNNFVGMVESLLSPKGNWYKCRLVWAGDYMDYEVFIPANYEGNKEDINIYEYVGRFGKKIKPKHNSLSNKYIINHTKKEYVDKAECQVDHEWQSDPWKIHPLPLLTCHASANGRGGGDYHGKDMKNVGRWCGDLISIENTKPEEYKEIKPKFKEITKKYNLIIKEGT